MAITKVSSGLISADASSIDLNIDAGTLYLDVSENRVGIGTSSPDEILHVNAADSGNSLVAFTNSTTGLTTEFVVGINASEQAIIYNENNTDMIFATNDGEKMRIDSSGNVLVGKTATGGNTAGMQIIKGSFFSHVRDGGVVQVLNRKTSDGDILQFEKDNTTVGSIGTRFGDLTIGTGNCGLIFNDGTEIIIPANITTNAVADAAVDLGYSAGRFKDLYLSGTANVGANISLDANDSYVGFPSNGIYYNNSADHISVKTAGAERMRIDGSGNLLVGTTNPSMHTASTGNGVVAASSGRLYVASTENTGASTTVGVFNRISTDGSLVQFKKNGTAVGSIGTAGGGAVYISDGTYGGLGFSTLGAGDINPVNTTGGVRDGAADLGQATARFRNLHLSGIVNVGTYLRFGGASNYYIHSDNANYLRFGTAGDERMRIDSSGGVGIAGTCATNRKLHVFGITRMEQPATSNSYQIEFNNPNGEVGSITSSGSATSYSTSSDYRLKENVDYTFNALDRVAQLKPARFNFIADADTTVDGFLAHEVQDIIPEAVTGEKDGEKMQSMDYGRITPLLVKAIQEQQTIIDDLKTRIETLENV